jgi:hypothetical protein
MRARQSRDIVKNDHVIGAIGNQLKKALGVKLPRWYGNSSRRVDWPAS